MSETRHPLHDDDPLPSPCPACGALDHDDEPAYAIHAPLSSTTWISHPSTEPLPARVRLAEVEAAADAARVTVAAAARSLGDGAGGSGDNRRHPTSCRFCEVFDGVERPATGFAYPEPQTALTRLQPSCGRPGHGVKFRAVLARDASPTEPDEALTDQQWERDGDAGPGASPND